MGGENLIDSVSKASAGNAIGVDMDAMVRLGKPRHRGPSQEDAESPLKVNPVEERLVPAAMSLGKTTTEKE